MFDVSDVALQKLDMLVEAINRFTSPTDFKSLGLKCNPECIVERMHFKELLLDCLNFTVKFTILIPQVEIFLIHGCDDFCGIHFGRVACADLVR
jgi:hypothetical protein